MSGGRPWTKAEEWLLRRLYPDNLPRHLVSRFPGRTKDGIKARATFLRLTSNFPRRHWKSAENKRFRRIYARKTNEQLARIFHCSVQQINAHSAKLGVHKDPAWLHARNVANGELLRKSGKSHRFPKGNVSWNKGLHRPGYSIGRGRMAETTFKKGQRPRNAVPVGTLVTDENGYLKRKMEESAGVGLSRFGWEFEHVRVWESRHGVVKPGFKVVFKDGNKQNVAIENLELLSDAEMMRRNSIHARRTPEQKEAIYALSALKAHITKKEKKRAQQKQQAIGPAGSSVRNAGGAEGQREAHGD